MRQDAVLFHFHERRAANVEVGRVLEAFAVNWSALQYADHAWSPLAAHLVYCASCSLNGHVVEDA